jgi:DNA-directed RNA polymerase specialized sigma24 family protein
MNYSEKDFYHLAECLASKYYHYHEQEYKDMAMDLDDILQECRIVVFTLLTNPPKHITGISLPLVKKAVLWKLSQLIGNFNLVYKQRQGLRGFIPLQKLEQDRAENLDDILVDGKYEQVSGSQVERLLKKSIKLEHLKKILPKNEYKILERRFKYGETFEKIGDEMKCSRQHIQQTYKRTIQKLRRRTGIKNGVDKTPEL